MLVMPRWTRARALWVGVGCLVAGVTTAAGQAPNPQQPVFRGGVNVVPVEVVVVDGNGQAVHGLTQDSFRIFDRRQPQKVTVFEEVTRETSSVAGGAPALVAPAVHADVADNRTASSQRLVVMVIDDLHIDKAREDRTKDLAKQVVDRIGAGGSMAVLFTSRNHSTEVTEDHAALLAAVNSLKAGQAERRPINVPETPGGRGNNGQAFFQNIQAFKTIADAAHMLASDDLRRKTFVMLSEGVNKNMTGMFDYAMTPCEAHGPVPTVAGQPAVVPCGASTELHQMMEDMRRSNVTMYIVDPRGAVSEGDLAKENFPAPGQLGAGGGGVTTQGRSGRPAAPRLDSPLRQYNPVRVAEDGLNIMAEATGGFAVTNTDDFDAGIQMIADDLNHYYLLGFNPSDPSGSEYRRLDVSVTGHPDWVLRFRRGYLPGGPPTPPDGSDPLISSVTPKTDLPLRLVAVPLPATNGSANARVSVVLEVSAPRTALDAQGLLHDDVTYQVVAVLEKKAQAVARVANEAKLALKPASTVSSSGFVSYQIPASLDLAPGTYQLRASASSTLAGKAGSVYLSVDVPDFSVAPIAVSGLAVGYADGPHVATASSETPEADLGLPFVPSLDRTFAQSDTLRTYAEIARTNLTIPVKATAAITGANGRPVVSAAQEIGANQHGRVDATLSLAAVPPGVYTLSVSVTDGHHNASREVGIIVK